jgi:transposase
VHGLGIGVVAGAVGAEQMLGRGRRAQVGEVNISVGVAGEQRADQGEQDEQGQDGQPDHRAPVTQEPAQVEPSPAGAPPAAPLLDLARHPPNVVDVGLEAGNVGGHDYLTRTLGSRATTARSARIAPTAVNTLRAELGSEHGTVKRVAEQLGYGTESVRLWVRQADIDDGHAPGVSTGEAARVRELEQENRELRRANEILKRAASFFGAELDRQSRR